MGRPTPLYHAARLSELTGGQVWLKREDLTHTGSHKINNALGQALLARRMGKPRVIAETGAGQHGVAAATACALLGLECIVYMGTEDMRRQEPNVQRMRLLGAEVVGVDAGARTLKEAVSAAIRDWVTNVASTHYIIGSCVGPAPYPALVRDLQRRIGDEARAELLERTGALPDRAIACVGGGSNAIGTFIPFVDDDGVELIGVEAAGEGLDTLRHSAPLTTGARGVLHGAMSAVLQDEEGQILEAHSDLRRARLSRRGPRARLAARLGPRPLRRGARRRGAAAFRTVAEREGILPALESSHAVAWLLANPGAGHRSRDAVRPRRQGPRGGARARGLAMSVTATGIDRIAAAFAGHGKRAALMPYLMGGYPDLEVSAAAGLAAAEAGADLIELGIPFSDPLADGPVIHAAATEALAAGATPHGVLRTCERIAERVPVVLMVYANVVLTAGLEAIRAARRLGGRRRPDRARPAARRGGRAPGRLRRRGPCARAARGSHQHPGADRGDRRRRARLRLHRLAHGHDGRARPRCRPASRRPSRGCARPPRCRWPSASASPRPPRPPRSRSWRTA